jgi:hypothetical protein
MSVVQSRTRLSCKLFPYYVCRRRNGGYIIARPYTIQRRKTFSVKETVGILFREFSFKRKAGICLMKSDVASPHFGSPVECNDLSLIVYTAQQSQVKKSLCKYSPSASEKNKTNNNLEKIKSRFYNIHRLNAVFLSLFSQVVEKLRYSAYSSSKYGEHFLFIKLIESRPPGPGHHARLQHAKYRSRRVFL